MDESVGYKIYNPNTGLFSNGGTKLWNLWGKSGKIWTSMGRLKSHLTMMRSYGRDPDEVYFACEIVILRSQESRSPIGLYL